MVYWHWRMLLTYCCKSEYLNIIFFGKTMKENVAFKNLFTLVIFSKKDIDYTIFF